MASFVLICHTNSNLGMQKNIDKPVAFIVPIHHPGGDVNGVVC